MDSLLANYGTSSSESESEKSETEDREDIIIEKYYSFFKLNIRGSR